MTNAPAINAKENVISEVRAEYDRTQLRIRELQALIDQSQVEVRRLQQRSVEVTTMMNRLEANFDTVPRNDIKIVYTNALDTRTRLLTMQNQLEKVQQDRTSLEQFSGTLQKITELLEGIPASAIPTPAAPTKGVTGTLRTTKTLSGELIMKIVDSQESDRQRLARMMHDGPAQSLTNFILQAEICRRLFDRNPDRAGEELENLKTSASTTFQKVRDFIFELRPMMLDDLGLVPTIRRYVAALEEKGGVRSKINVVGEERRRMEAVSEVTMFRSLQEVFSYARDLSMASSLEATLDVSANPIQATVIFNGKSLNETEESNDTKAFSLDSLKQRVELVGGTLEFFGSEEDNNRVVITLPAEEFN